LDAARHLAKEYGLTSVVTSFTPREELEAVAARYSVQGPRAERVATLLVEDTWERP
jgi:hypothetical protein